jgi:hypothetical protein
MIDSSLQGEASNDRPTPIDVHLKVDQRNSPSFAPPDQPGDPGAIRA